LALNYSSLFNVIFVCNSFYSLISFEMFIDCSVLMNLCDYMYVVEFEWEFSFWFKDSLLFSWHSESNVFQNISGVRVVNCSVPLYILCSLEMTLSLKNNCFFKLNYWFFKYCISDFNFVFSCLKLSNSRRAVVSSKLFPVKK